MNKIEVGKTYDTAPGRRRCIYVEDDIAWMIFGADSCAWRWTVNGASIDLGSIHDVIWPAEPPKTITRTITRTITYPAPETKAPAFGTEYFTPNLSSGSLQAWDWNDGSVHRTHLRQGLVYLTEEDAIARAKAMLE